MSLATERSLTPLHLQLSYRGDYALYFLILILSGQHPSTLNKIPFQVDLAELSGTCQTLNSNIKDYIVSETFKLFDRDGDTMKKIARFYDQYVTSPDETIVRDFLLDLDLDRGDKIFNIGLLEFYMLRYITKHDLMIRVSLSKVDFISPPHLNPFLRVVQIYNTFTKIPKGYYQFVIQLNFADLCVDSDWWIQFSSSNETERGNGDLRFVPLQKILSAELPTCIKPLKSFTPDDNNDFLIKSKYFELCYDLNNLKIAVYESKMTGSQREHLEGFMELRSCQHNRPEDFQCLADIRSGPAQGRYRP